MKEITPRSGIDSVVRIPGSKSITHRALIAAALAEGESVLENFLACEDTLYTARGLQSVGTEIYPEGSGAKVRGTGGRFNPSRNRKVIFLGNSGTSYRFLLSTLALAQGEYLLKGSPRMHQRPLGSLVEALQQLGAAVSCARRDGFPPVSIKAAGLRGGKAKISGNKSSQYISSILLSTPYAEKDTEIEVSGNPVSMPYVDLTVDVMERFGVTVCRKGSHYFRISSGQRYRPCRFSVEGDVSSASYFWAAAAVTGGVITTRNIFPSTTVQGDIGFLEILEQMGCTVRRGRDQVAVQGNELSGIDADMSQMPDLVPTLTALALFARGKTVIRNVAHLRYKETDRLRALWSIMSRLGARIELLKDGLIIQGRANLFGKECETYGDHRMAMSLAIVGLRVSRVTIKEEGCVRKSFPNFWELWDKI